MKREVLLIFKGVIHNAMRHSSCRRVEIELTVRSGWLAISIQDDGVGVSDAEGRLNSGGHGLSNIRNRATRVGGTLEVTSLAERGVTSMLRVALIHRRARWRMHAAGRG